eukprot:GHVS01083162.1.p2 GENE.GHVS01083162.1~~GHVS01083162.1.p2  ORF type:complete len:164 (-),score=48.85 GHVS01083162.1:945-1436(-)
MPRHKDVNANSVACPYCTLKMYCARHKDRPEQIRVKAPGEGDTLAKLYDDLVTSKLEKFRKVEEVKEEMKERTAYWQSLLEKKEASAAQAADVKKKKKTKKKRKREEDSSDSSDSSSSSEDEKRRRKKKRKQRKRKRSTSSDAGSRRRRTRKSSSGESAEKRD